MLLLIDIGPNLASLLDVIVTILGLLGVFVLFGVIIPLVNRGQPGENNQDD